MLFQGIGTRIDMKPYIFVIFQGGGGVGPPAPPPLDPHMEHINMRLLGEIGKVLIVTRIIKF